MAGPSSPDIKTARNNLIKQTSIGLAIVSLATGCGVKDWLAKSYDHDAIQRELGFPPPSDKPVVEAPLPTKLELEVAALLKQVEGQFDEFQNLPREKRFYGLDQAYQQYEKLSSEHLKAPGKLPRGGKTLKLAAGALKEISQELKDASSDMAAAKASPKRTYEEAYTKGNFILFIGTKNFAEGALPALHSALLAHGRTARLSAYLAYAYFVMGRDAAGLDELNRANSQCMGNADPEVLNLLQSVRQKSSELAAGPGVSTEMKIKFCKIMLAEGKTNEAQRLLSGVAAGDLEKEDILTARMIVAYMQGKGQEAADLAARRSKDTTSSFESSFILGMSAIRTGDDKNGLASLEAAARAKPSVDYLPPAQIEQWKKEAAGTVSLLKNPAYAQYPLLLAQFCKERRWKDDMPRPDVQLACETFSDYQKFLRSGNLEQAEALAQKLGGQITSIQQLNKSLSDAQRRYQYQYVCKTAYNTPSPVPEDMVKFLIITLTEEPDARLFNKLACYYHKSGASDLARISLSRSVQLAPSSCISRANLIAALSRLPKEERWRQLEKTTSKIEDWALVECLRAWLQIAEQDYIGAEKRLMSILNNRALAGDAQRAMAVIRIRQSRADEAEQHLSHSLTQGGAQGLSYLTTSSLRALSSLPANHNILFPDEFLDPSTLECVMGPQNKISAASNAAVYYPMYDERPSAFTKALRFLRLKR